MYRTYGFAFLMMAAFALSTLPSNAVELTYVDLVERLTDLGALAVLPAEGESCQQFSSYDRRSLYDAETGGYIQWAANGDGTGLIRREGDREVFAEMEGPGVIWRIWSARAGAGHVRIYLDGAEAPAVDLPFDAYFNGENPPFQGEALCHTTARGRNCYVPIPYQKSCRIVADKGWGRYYHFTYTTYPEDTVLPTFSLPLSKEDRRALERANELLTGNLGQDPAGGRQGEKYDERRVTVPAGETALVAGITGPRAITGMRVNLDLPEPPEDISVLRELCLKITWDGAPSPQVWCPLGDFFGMAPGYHRYASLPLGVTAEEGMYSFWYMPFAREAVVELVNDGESERSVTVDLTHAPLSRPLDGLGRFHAKWHRDVFLPDDPARRAIDWTMLKTRGRGRFTGVMLHIWNPRGRWWGEGDEKFFVDGEDFPSTFGTGSEDYFGYAWCSPELFENAFHNQPHNDGHNRGHVSVNRWQIADNVPFQNSFEAAIEKYFPNTRPTLYAAVAYWYQAPGGEDPYSAVPVGERSDYFGDYEVPRVKGALEGEELRVGACTGGRHRIQDMGNYRGEWSNIRHLWWTGGKPGDRMTLAVPVKTPGKYRVCLQLTRAKDYGIVRLSLNGQPLGEPVDLYNPNVVPTGELDMGIHQLSEERARLTLEIVGANQKAVKSYMAGLDYVLLKSVQ